MKNKTRWSELTVTSFKMDQSLKIWKKDFENYIKESQVIDFKYDGYPTSQLKDNCRICKSQRRKAYLEIVKWSNGAIKKDSLNRIDGFYTVWNKDKDDK